MKKLTTEEFIAKSREKHGDAYDYTLTAYTTSKEKVTIVCPVHGEFKQSANSHLQGYGCNKCAVAYRASLETQTLEEYILKAQAKHDCFYTYETLKYTTVHAKGTITCPIHGNFEQKLNSHLAGRGCKECGKAKAGNSRSFFTGKHTILYVLKLAKSAFKVGVTSRNSIAERYYGDAYNDFETVFQVSFFNGKDAYNIEQQIIKEFSSYSYAGDRVFKRTKNYEVFTKDPTKAIINNIKECIINANK